MNYQANEVVRIAEREFAHLFHYRTRACTVTAICKTGRILVDCETIDSMHVMCNEKYLRPRANFTVATPDEGRTTIAAATFLNPKVINYGLELLIPLDKYRVRTEFEHLPRSRQIFSPQPVEVKVLRVWDVDKASRRKMIFVYTSKGIHASYGLPLRRTKPVVTRIAPDLLRVEAFA